MFFDPLFFLFIAPAVLLAFAAQAMVKSAYAKMSRVPASMTGAQAARRILDANGLQNVRVEPIGGELSDHYDPRAKTLRLSQGVYGVNSMSAVGIAAHEAGHALQDAKRYAPLVVRNLAVPAANFGSSISTLLLMAGLGILIATGSALGSWIFLAGIVSFGMVVFFQLVNLPVEFDASARAKKMLGDLGIVRHIDMPHVSKVLNAAALTYVAATLQAVLTLAYYIFRYVGIESDRES